MKQLQCILHSIIKNTNTVDDGIFNCNRYLLEKWQSRSNLMLQSILCDILPACLTFALSISCAYAFSSFLLLLLVRLCSPFRVHLLKSRIRWTERKTVAVLLVHREKAEWSRPDAKRARNNECLNLCQDLARGNTVSEEKSKGETELHDGRMDSTQPQKCTKD